MCVPINTRCGIHWDRKNKKINSIFLKSGCYEDILMHLIDAVYEAV